MMLQMIVSRRFGACDFRLTIPTSTKSVPARPKEKTQTQSGIQEMSFDPFRVRVAPWISQ
jgi:hypothetical protein